MNNKFNLNSVIAHLQYDCVWLPYVSVFNFILFVIAVHRLLPLTGDTL